jgi:hypothetical protein
MNIPFLRPVVPPHVFCLLPGGVTYANVRREPPRGFAHARHFAYPAGTVGQGGAGTPVYTREAISEAVEAGRRLSEGRLTRASVVFPDSWARILPIDFETLPDSADAARDVIRWKVKKLLPGITADLDVVSREMTPLAEGRRILVAAAPSETLQSVERSFEAAGVRVGMMAPASLVLFEGFSEALGARASGDYGLVHVAPDAFVLILARDGSPIFFRQRPAEEDPEEHEQEIRLSLSYYAEKLNGSGLRAVWTHDSAGGRAVPGAAFPIPPTPLSGVMFDADRGFDQSLAARPELLAAFAAVYGKR